MHIFGTSYLLIALTVGIELRRIYGASFLHRRRTAHAAADRRRFRSRLLCCPSSRVLDAMLDAMLDTMFDAMLDAILDAVDEVGRLLFTEDGTDEYDSSLSPRSPTQHDYVRMLL